MVRDDESRIRRDRLVHHEYEGQEFLVDTRRGRVYVDLPKNRGVHEVIDPVIKNVLNEMENGK